MASDLPSWLQAPPPSEPFQALLAGVRAGTAIGSNILQGQRQAEQAREFQTQFEAEQVLRNQQEQLNKLHIENMIRDNQEKIDSEGAYQKVASLYSRHQALEIAGTPGSEAAIGNVIANNPSFFVHPGSKSLMADMAFSNRVRTVAEQREADAASRLEQVQAQQAGALQRTEATVAGKQDVANLQFEAAKLKAGTEIEKANIAASKWKDHSRFAAFKSAASSIATSINPALEPEKYSAAVKGVYNQLLPSGEPNSPWDSTTTATPVAPTLAPVDPMPQTQEEFDAIPSGTWFINPADGKRMRKK